MVTVETASLEHLTEQEVNRMYDLLIYAYAETEKEIWGENYVRLSMDEFLHLIQEGRILVARINNEVVGSIGLTREQEDAFSFGLLNADFALNGQGVGKGLIHAAEKYALDHGATYMLLEILRPSNFDVPIKIQLDQWYQKLGYQFKESMLFEERKPDKASKALKLITPCQFDCYEKRLI